MNSVQHEGMTERGRWDPRFSTRAGGSFDRTTFRRRYGFIDEMREDEVKALKKAHKELRRRTFTAPAMIDRDGEEDGGDDGAEIAVATREKAHEVKEQLKRLENQVRSAKMEKMEAETRHELRRTNIDRMRKGQRPIYLNNDEFRKRVWSKKYEQLREKNQLDGYLEKRAKKGKKIY